MSIKSLNALNSCILLLSLTLSGLAFAKLDPSTLSWEVHKVHSGDITVFKAKEAHKSGLIPLKAQSIINHSIPKILTVISDADRKSEWVPYLEDARTIDIVDTYNRVEYARYNSPWPFNDRVFVIRIKSSFNPKTQEVLIELWSIEHPKAPHNKDHVRGETYAGRVILRPEDNGKKTFFEVMFLTDFKGNIPKWIINMVQKKWPVKMLKRLNAQLSKPDIKILPEYLPKHLRIPK